jgi:uncharacterized coiled-coil protein SlyX
VTKRETTEFQAQLQVLHSKRILIEMDIDELNAKIKERRRALSRVDKLVRQLVEANT